MKLKGRVNMIGIPKHLNTREDYEFLKTNFPASVWKPRFQDLLTDRMQWFNTGVLNAGDAGMVDATHKVVEDETVKYQFELKNDPGCALNRLGFSIEEVEAFLAEDE